ncbi:uncharacterized protein LOC143039302 [Oratosquilla oratoria]|uniref:uncharacterized protein LOC143039302 n=1 Tax=Oratosquilla oratoria TaxID=337810 RepID=UPI003F776DB8
MVVRWKGHLSRSSAIDMGVPQGSVVVPLLFTLLLGDVGKGVRKDTVVTAYADDIALWRKSRHRRPKKDSDQHKSELRLSETVSKFTLDLSIVKSLVRSRLLFRSPAMHDHPPGVVYRLARVECQALRLGLGLPASVPHEQVYSEAASPTSIFSAELIAIREAIKIVIALPHPPTSITVLSDSRASLKALQSCQCGSQPDTLQEILHLTAEASDKDIQIRYQWVPSHVGLHGNEKADGAAKKGALAPEEDMISIKFTVIDALHKINRAIWETWKADYTATAIARG